MKKIIITSFCLLSLTAFSQKKKFVNTPRSKPVDSTYYVSPRKELQSTTDIEYNYMTKGYRIEQESGLDRKQGYDVDLLRVFDSDKYNFEFIALKSDKHTVVGVICKALDKSNSKLYYLGIPVNNPDLEPLYFKSVRDMGTDMVYYYSQISSLMIAPLTAGIYLK